ncbi:hypothetical protein C8Q78DRAFT_965194 [Trametes maxima]|nr:hypothetical protein C8Q78DRAFT_965194 [Trametes maxima]
MDDLEHPGDATISSAFQPSLRIDDRLPDLIIVSENNVYFYVHRHRIANASANNFGGFLLFSPGAQSRGFNLPTLRLPQSGDTLNVVLHTLYGLSCLHFHPTLETVEAALTALTNYGASIQALAAPYQPLNALILSHAPYRPIETYALVGHYQLDELAVTVSGHLLSFDLSTVTDALATRMGPVYLKRLFLLHQVRIHALKDIILRPPGSHGQAPGCSDAEQAKLTRAWALATAQLVWDATPSMSPNSLRALLEPIVDTLACGACKQMLQQRVQEVVYSWSQVTVRRSIVSKMLSDLTVLPLSPANDMTRAIIPASLSCVPVRSRSTCRTWRFGAIWYDQLLYCFLYYGRLPEVPYLNRVEGSLRSNIV